MLDRRLKLGTFLGIGLYVHWTFALLIGFFAYQASDEGIAGMAFAITMVLGVFFCVTLHEYGHALAARKFGIPTIDITLLPIGGVARLQRMPRIPWQELVVAIAGPAVNVVIATLLGIGFVVVGGINLFMGVSQQAEIAVETDTMFSPSFSKYAFYMLMVNITLVIFNMIPAFPMDGGRVFRSVLAMITDYRKATVIASRVGILCAVSMIALVVFTGNPNPIPILIAVFIAFAGMAEARQVEVTESVRGLTVRQAMIRSLEALPMDMPLSEVARRWQTSKATALPVLSITGSVIGMLRLEEVSKATAMNIDPMTPAGQLINHNESDTPVHIDEALDSVVLRVGHRGRQVAVVDGEGKFAGVLDLNSMIQRGNLPSDLPEPSNPDDRFDALS